MNSPKKGIPHGLKNLPSLFPHFMVLRGNEKKSSATQILIVKFWKENLEETDGYAFWIEGDDIEYNHFMPTNAFSK